MEKNFGEKLRLLRNERNLSLDEVAYDIGITKSTISKYERNVVDPTLDSAKKLADYFMVTLDWLVRENVPEKPELMIPENYIKIIKKAINQNVSAENLNEALNLILKLRH